jgi:hypothetical protein
VVPAREDAFGHAGYIVSFFRLTASEVESVFIVVQQIVIASRNKKSIHARE